MLTGEEVAGRGVVVSSHPHIIARLYGREYMEALYTGFLSLGPLLGLINKNAATCNKAG
jgi:hypothetical protein